MHPSTVRGATRCLLVVLCLACCTRAVAQSTGGRILGRVADQSGAVLPTLNVTLTHEATGVSRTVQTNANGDYVFVEVQPGTYELVFDQQGFKKNVRKGVTVEINQVVTLNMTMTIGETKETVEVTSEAPLVDTTSTQLGAVVNNRSVNELPLNQRDTYQFLQMQPGVQSQLGSSGDLFAGSSAAGSVSVNGGRGRANNFSVNGGDANDTFVNAAVVQPTPDAIEEFRVITNTFDPEYGRNSGAVVNVVTKSGTNAFHGDIYEYFRNKVLNAQGFLNTIKPQFNQNQFGGTLGGPLKKDRTFFFGSYEGRRVRQGTSGEIVAVPTPAERVGDFSAGPAFQGGIFNNFVAQVLDGRSGCDAALGLPAGGIATTLPPNPNGLIPWSTVFPTNHIPPACMDPVAVDLLRFMPPANRPDGTFQAVPASSDDQNQFTVRFDHRINDRQNFTAYYYFTNENLVQPFNTFQAAGATVPGFAGSIGQRFQQWNLSHTWTLSNAVVNEARFTYLREGQLTFQHPLNTGLISSYCLSPAAQAVCFNGVSDSSAINNLIASQGVPAGKAGITPGLPPSHTGLPFISIGGGAVIGNNSEGELPQVGNSFQWADNLTWIRGSHTVKFGADVRRSRFDQTLFFDVNGAPVFNSSAINAISFSDNYPGYLLGLVDSYTQGSAQRENIRNTGVYLFAQDSWKIRANLTFNYGLRWELDTPLTDISRHVQTFRSGQNSTIYPCDPAVTPLSDCPTGLVIPGDKGIPPGMTQTYYKAFAPRFGIAWSPGSSGKTSIRAGWGLFYNPMEQLVLEQFSAEPPFGSSPGLFANFFNTPFISQAGTVTPNGFNGILNPPRGQDPGWSTFRPILLFGEFQPHMRTQYAAQYNLSIQRELSKDIVLQVNYVGSQGHRLLASHDINAANPQTCLDIMNIASNSPTSVTDGLGNQVNCGPLAEDGPYVVSLPSNGAPFHLPNGSMVTSSGQTLHFVGLRPFSSPNCDPLTGANCPIDGTPVFTNIFAEDTIAASAYNSLQTMLEKRFSHGVQLQAAYTFSKSLDWASTFEETLNPFNFKASRAPSLFNSKHRFVISYIWELPVPRYRGVVGKLVDDWQISGITQFQSGFPIRLQTQNDNELISSVFFLGTAAPQLNGPLHILDPKHNASHQYLDPTQFSDPPLGQFATTSRSLCCGPGLNNWDITFAKKITLTEAKYFQFRADIFNLANHTQFVNPVGNFSNSNFGQVTKARDPRLVQFALKFYF